MLLCAVDFLLSVSVVDDGARVPPVEVLLLAQHPHGNWVYDLDSTLPFPSQAPLYMTRAFQKGAEMDDRYRQ